MLQLHIKLKLYTKQGPETVHKYLHQNLFAIIYRLPAPTKVIFTTGTSHWTTALSVKSILGIILPENTLGSIKCLYFDTIISPNLKKEKKFQAGKIDDFFQKSWPTQQY